jgi:hypothetical protein
MRRFFSVAQAAFIPPIASPVLSVLRSERKRAEQSSSVQEENLALARHFNRLLIEVGLGSKELG